ncbi:MAG: methylmalonyl Co-A mutase-associated GTPase MeaB [Alphaproteobacteria bacterium]|nr:methylmalonyl Co-A mutase-associated GTPase MeaB [Alphaproteobacteria bacterium]
MKPNDIRTLAENLVGGDRRALARAVTLVESTRSDHRRTANQLLGEISAYTGGAIRVGISGAPGVGKSTFIETFGNHVLTQGHKIAVLAVDPSSPRSGGSILGDKTRMETLARNPATFIRPSPSGGALGGLARRTREAMLICEAAGFDLVIVETVGAGQSEAAVADLVDVFVLLLPPAGGDQLQGLKKGIVELADIIVVNKADGDLARPANQTQVDYQGALTLLAKGTAQWSPPVLLASAIEGTGIDAVWNAIGDCRADHSGPDGISAKRAAQAKSWMWRAVEEKLLAQVRSDAQTGELIASLEQQVVRGDKSPSAASEEIIAGFSLWKSDAGS